MKFLVKRDTGQTFKSNFKTNLKAHIAIPDESDSYCSMFNSEDTQRGRFKITQKTTRPICKLCEAEYLKKNPDAKIVGKKDDTEQGSLF